MHFLVAIATLWLASALRGAESRPHVVASFLPVYCWSVNVAGDSARVENLLSARSNPHDYAFKPSDASKLARADLVVVNGLGLESWLRAFLRATPSATNKMVAVTSGLNTQLIYGEHHHHHAHDDGHGHEREQPNEHTWLDPILAAYAVSNILAALQRIDPARANTYERNAHTYIARLQALDAEIRDVLKGVTNRAIVTYHDAFPYFAKRYQLEIAGVVEQVPGVNPTMKHLSRLGRTIRERGIRVICVPPGGGSPIARRIAADLRVDVIELDTLESGPLSPSAYEERMRQNAATLRRYLR